MLPCAILLYLCLILCKALSTTKTFPGAIFTKENSRLKGYSFKWHVAPSQISCTQACLANPRCYSTNFKEVVHSAKHEGTCEMNTDHPFDPISLEHDLHYEFGSLYARYSRDSMDDCQWIGCQNNGACVKLDEEYTCKCNVYWIGKFCETKNRWYNFTTLGATGRNGPVSAAGYRGTLLQEVQVKDGVQEWQVPITGKYSVEACGASGGNGLLLKKGGKGAKVSGSLTLSKGEELAILVGQKGSTQDGSHPGSGGGGTFVYRSSDKYNPILVAGGGGGGGNQDGLPGNDSPGGSGTGAGTNGGGGQVCRDGSYSPDSGTGAGYLGNGGCLENGKLCGNVHCSEGGISMGKGGVGPASCDGGFGGGGACGNFPGGGGGYSGGGVAPEKVGGGGGSYKLYSSLKVIKGGCEEGDGYVSFTAED